MEVGIYFRIKRGNAFVTLDLTEMTDEEIHESLSRFNPDSLKRTIVRLVRMIEKVED